MKVSFIIPVYKVEKYLDESVESIISQTYKDFEILLVDDESPDDSPTLCDEWAGKDERVIALHKSNGGLSDARNYGLQQANGDYVVFIDGDDFWLNSNELEKLIGLAQKYPNVDFIGFNCKYYYPETNRYSCWAEYDEELAKPVDKNMAVCTLVKSGTFPMSACLKLINREFLINNNIYFVKGQIAEDIPWFINLLDKAKKCMFVNNYIYAYRQNVAGSISNTVSERSFNSLYNIFKTELKKVETRSFNDESKSAIKSFLAYEYSILIADQYCKGTAKEDLFKYKSILGFTLNPKVRLVNRLYSIFGLNIIILFLKSYLKLRASKK